MKTIRSDHRPTVSVFIHCFPPARGGAEFLTNEISKILETKFDVHIFTGQGLSLDSYKTFDNFIDHEYNPNIHRLNLNIFVQRIFNKFLHQFIIKFGFLSHLFFGPILNYTPQDLKIIKSSKYIFGVAMPTKAIWDAYCFSHKYKKKLIVIPTYHNVSYYNHSPFFQKAFDYASKILYLTSFEKNELLKNYKIDKTKLIQTTFCPYTQKQIITQQKNLLKINKKHQKNFRNKQITIGFIGQITLRKNLDFFKIYLDKYLFYWQKKGYNLKVYLAGAKTNSSSQIEILFKKYLDQKIVTIKYNFDNKEKEFSKIDIFINPSEEESLGIVNFEAIYFGCQLIVHNHSAFTELIGRNNTFLDFNESFVLTKKMIHIPNYHLAIAKQQNIFNKYNHDNFQKIIINLVC